jgi:molybdopterin molybdotransferase
VIPLDEAQREVLEGCPPLGAEQVPVSEALGLVLAGRISSPEAVPPFRNTAMDGFAVRASDTSAASGATPVRLTVIGTLAAGHAPTVEVGPGQALRIMTGAPFPEGADSVAIVETTEADGDDVLINVPAVQGEHIRPAGSDIGEGQDLFPAGTVLGPGHLGVLCSVGRATVTATRPPVVGVMSTGDELKEVSEKLAPGEIRDSNRRTLISLLQRDGFDVVDLGIARDVEAEIERVLSDGVERCDAVLTSGGVSMGDFDFVKSVLDRMGKMTWMQVAIRPAKPFAFGLVGDTPVFGLPGNPVSSMVSYEVLARPGLRRMAGHADDDLHRRPVEATVEDGGWRGGSDGRTSFVRVKARFVEGGRLAVSSAGGQGSHQLHAMALADSLAITPPGVQISHGDAVQVLLLGS